MKLHAELIFIWMRVSHLDSFWNRGTRELRNGLKQRFPIPVHCFLLCDISPEKIDSELRI